VGLGLIALGVRDSGGDRRRAVRLLAPALAIALSPACVYILVNLLSNHPGLGIVSVALKLAGQGRSILDAGSYVWQFYLPRLPGMTSQFPWLFVPREVWFDRWVGFYGWLDTSFPQWVDDIALIPAALIALLCVGALIALRTTMRRRLIEIAVYAAMGIGLAALIAASNFVDYTEGLSYAEPRYLLPLLPLIGVAVALAARGAGQRWGRSIGVLIVVLVLGHDVFSQLLVVSRYYG
jgi:hypothetical protein